MCVKQSNQPSGSGLHQWHPQDDDLRSSRFPLSFTVASVAQVRGLDSLEHRAMPSKATSAPPPFLGLGSGPPFPASGAERLVRWCAGRRRIKLCRPPVAFEKSSGDPISRFGWGCGVLSDS